MKRKKISIAAARTNVDDEVFPFFRNLPSHLTDRILLQLPIKSLLVCKSVCKTWKTLISESHFAKSHFEQSQPSLMIRTGPVSRTMYLLHCDPQKFEIGSNHRVKLAPIFKIPLRSFRERDEINNESKRPLRAARLISGKKDENIDRGRQSLHIACNSDFDKFNIVNSCNGLLCLSDPSLGNPLVICNPITGEFIRLPESTMNGTRVRRQGQGAFGFQPKTNEYKVINMRVRSVKRGNWWWESELVILEINTLGTPSWRNVEVDPQIYFRQLKYPTCVNGALHWLRYEGLQMSILVFCFESERLKSFPSPPHGFGNHNNGTRGNSHVSMGELKGFLYICDWTFLSDVPMWVMKEHGIEESWTKVYKYNTSFIPLDRPVSWRSGLWPIKHFEEGAAILLYDYNCLFYYEPAKNRCKAFQIHGSRSDSFEVIPHIPSLISLKDVLKGDSIKVLNIHSR